ncbi:MAG TPA: mannose-1-phosphate guanyltransferase [Lentisphaeria bacterium]|nr:MAG: mannose-1-phosphate guanyltransferase [Lentisphaerae bacterium GWF2_38_69]HBM16597.1 mannose-1-phosphate guanyltransferase [Lentisphaeria bacterium]
MKLFSIKRAYAVFLKEFLQLRRDRLTAAMLFGIPVVQLILFGFAINNNPKHLPTILDAGNYSDPFVSKFIHSLQKSEYFDISSIASTEKSEKAIRESDVYFIISVEEDFNRKMVRGERPEILIDADATDPQVVTAALSVAKQSFNNLMGEYFKGSLGYLTQGQPGANLIIHKRYNPEGVMQFSTVPGLLGVILTFTLVIITALSMTKEIERDTMENLLCMPVTPLEVLIGKVMPYIGMGFIQMIFIIVLSKYMFDLPIVGSVFLLLCSGLLFIFACLSVGIVFSTLARNQLQAVQMSVFFYLPSIMLSGFMFPFKAMPVWAQCIGYVLPLTHFNVIVRSIMLKGATFSDIKIRILIIAVFAMIVLTVGVFKYRKTIE